MNQTETIIKAIQFVGSLNRLAECAANGIIPFSHVTDGNCQDYENCAIYIDDPSDPEIHGGMAVNDIILGMGMVVTDVHHAAVRSWAKTLSDLCGEPVVARVEGMDDEPYVAVIIGGTWPEDGTCPDDATVIVVQDGGWHVV